MLRDEHLGLGVEEVYLGAGSKLKDETVGQLKHRNIPGLLIVALCTEKTGAWIYNPADSEPLHEGTSIVFMGLPETQKSMSALVRQEPR